MQTMLNILALAILAVVIGKILKNRNSTHRFEEWNWAVIAIFGQIVLDYLIIVFGSGKSNVFCVLNYITSFLYYLFTPMATYFWARYIYKYAHGTNKISKTVNIVLVIPIIVNAILSVLSIWLPIYFKIGANNLYSRGVGTWISVAIAYFYFVFATIILIINKHHLRRSSYYSCLLFPVPTLMASILQMIFYGMSIMWQFASVSVLLVYMYNFEEAAYTDELTGLYTRKKFMERIRDVYDGIGKTNDKYFCIIFDLDKFKDINDKYGHNVGDLALIETSNILLKSFSTNAVICRYGGDEFVALQKITSDDEIKGMVKRFTKNFTEYNKYTKGQFKLFCSYGYDTFDKTSTGTFSEFMSEIDQKVYEQKEIHHLELEHYADADLTNVKL